MHMRYIFGTVIFLVLVLSGCNQGDTAEKDSDYEQTKKMVVDILNTDEGKQAMQKLLADEAMQEQLIMDTNVVKESITEALNSEKQIEMWKKLFQDSEFIKIYTKILDQEQKELFKGLMHDAAFQKQMLELLQNPEMMEQTLTMLKSQQFREHLEETIQETLSSPLFQSKIEDILLKASENKTEEKEEDNDDSGDKKDEK